MIRKPSGSEWFIIVVALVYLVTFSRDNYIKWRERRFFEDRMNDYVPFTQKALDLPEDISVKSANLSGKWVMMGCRNSSSLRFQQKNKDERNQYYISFETRLCSSSYSTLRTARYQNGIIDLSEPLVGNVVGSAYKKLYVVQVGAKRLLIPESVSENTQNIYNLIKLAENKNDWHEIQSLVYMYEE